MKKRYILMGALMALSPRIVAQTTGDGEEAAEVFRPHTYIQMGGGAQYTLGEASPGDLLSPNVQVAAGWQFRPWLGARLAVGAWQSRGGINGVMTAGGAVGRTYKYSYVAPAADLVFNLSNVICGYSPTRVASLTAFVGAGVNIAFSNDEAMDITRSGYELAYVWDGTCVRPVGRAGIGLDLRLSRAVSIGLEANANVTSDKYNSKKAGNADWYFNALAGVRVAIGRTTRKAAPASQPEPVIPVAEEPAPKPVEQELRSEPTTQPAEAKAAEPVRRDIFFRINSFAVRDSEMEKLAELAGYLKANPEAQLRVTGYADAATGTAAINERLSAKRAAEVARLLVRKFGIAAGRIVTAHEGSRVQPFADNESNRVSICVTEE
ncbi:MAG: OmpA family protein [Prevotella sp.]|nr:OmpA family protein [Prevotella sp.]